jgi:hypothetical protein
MKEHVPISAVDWQKMSKKEDRLFVYAVASWITRLDGEVTANESRARSWAPSPSERPRQHADAIAVAALPQGDRPSRFDIPRLRELIATRLKRRRRHARRRAPPTPDAGRAAEPAAWRA